MSFTDEFESNLVSLAHVLQKKYSLLRDLDKSLQENQRQNEQRCEKEIDDIRRGKTGNVTTTPNNTSFSEEALDEQKHSVRIADEKVALAMQAYDLVDMHVQQLDQHMKKTNEKIRKEKETAAAALNVESSGKAGKASEGGRGGRNKTRLAIAASTAAAEAEAAASTGVSATGMDLDLPVDPNEPTYCICNQVSYGEMIACDNNACKIEWFHFGCVGLKEQPKGKWYCPDCTTVKKSRRGR